MTKITKKNNKFLIMLIFILTFGFVIVFSDFCSSLITIKAFNSITNSASLSSYNVYAIVLKSFNTKNNAVEYALTIQKQNGAGYILCEKNQFDVLASCYIEENDAKLVKSNLEASGLNPTIKKMSFQGFTLTGKYSNTELNIINSALSIYKTIYENLYDISVALDANVTDENESKLFIADIENLINKTKLNFESTFSNQTSSEMVYIKLSLNNLYSKIIELKNFEKSSNQTLSSKIKYTYFEILELNKNLSENI